MFVDIKSRIFLCNISPGEYLVIHGTAAIVLLPIVPQECGALTEDGIVIQILDKSFDVLAGRLGLVRRVYCDVSRSQYGVVQNIRGTKLSRFDHLVGICISLSLQPCYLAS